LSIVESGVVSVVDVVAVEFAIQLAVELAVRGNKMILVKK
jgi:hypothetical protein